MKSLQISAPKRQHKPEGIKDDPIRFKPNADNPTLRALE